MVRNFNDCFIYTGLFWDACINIYLISNLNIAKDIMFDSQSKTIKQLIALNLVQFIVFLALKSVSMYVPSDFDKADADSSANASGSRSQQVALERKRRLSLASVRKKSFIDGSNCTCCSTRCRNLSMFIAIGVVFFVLPVLLLLLALANEFSSSAEDDETATADAGASDTARLLQSNGVTTSTDADDSAENDPEGEPLKIVGTWIFISLLAMISFGYIELSSMMIKLYKQFKDPEKIKPKNKALGGYSPEDPLRQLKMRESIYSLAFAVNLKNSKMDELGGI